MEIEEVSGPAMALNDGQAAALRSLVDRCGFRKAWIDGEGIIWAEAEGRDGPFIAGMAVDGDGKIVRSEYGA